MRDTPTAVATQHATHPTMSSNNNSNNNNSNSNGSNNNKNSKQPSFRPVRKMLDLFDVGPSIRAKSNYYNSAMYKSLPLSGASIYLLPFHDNHNHKYEKETVHVTIEALGGKVVPHVKDATHALWMGPDHNTLEDEQQQQEARQDTADERTGKQHNKNNNNSKSHHNHDTTTTKRSGSPRHHLFANAAANQNARRIKKMEKLLQKCKSSNIPVVDTEWLEQVSGIMSTEHWSDINVNSYLPKARIVQQVFFTDLTSIVDSDNDYVHVSPPPSPENNKRRTTTTTTTKTTTTTTTPPTGKKIDATTQTTKPKKHKSTTTTKVPVVNNKKTTSKDHRRRDESIHLSDSIAETYHYLAAENPELLEEDALKRAIELSMLDWAIVVRTNDNIPPFPHEANKKKKKKGQTPHELLRISPNASQTEIKAAYRKRAKETHPDKGGNANEFEKIARAYRYLLRQNNNASAHGLTKTMSDITTCTNYTTATAVNGMSSSNNKQLSIKTTAHWDSELRDHRGLINELFQNHGTDLDSNICKQLHALEQLGLQFIDVGGSNINEKNELIRNSCFYLSLATSYLAGIGALEFHCETNNNEKNGSTSNNNNDSDNSSSPNTIFKTIAKSYYETMAGVAAAADTSSSNKNKDEKKNKQQQQQDEEKSKASTVATIEEKMNQFNLTTDQALIGETALDLKRTIEAAVVSAHPEWAASGMVGEEVQAFSDFLVYVLDSPTILSDWAVVIFDSASGFVDIYKGVNYNSDDSNWAKSNTITLRYTPGHYQPLLPTKDHQEERPTLHEMLLELEKAGVMYVITDGSGV